MYLKGQWAEESFDWGELKKSMSRRDRQHRKTLLGDPLSVASQHIKKTALVLTPLGPFKLTHGLNHTRRPNYDNNRNPETNNGFTITVDSTHSGIIGYYVCKILSMPVTSSSQPIVTHSLTVNNDFTWTAFVHGHQVNDKTSQALANFSEKLDHNRLMPSSCS